MKLTNDEVSVLARLLKHHVIIADPRAPGVSSRLHAVATKICDAAASDFDLIYPFSTIDTAPRHSESDRAALLVCPPPTKTVRVANVVHCNGLVWELLNAGKPGHLGIIPDFLDGRDDRDAVAQINESYAHGGGWNKFDGFELVNRNFAGVELPFPDWRLQYPDDPAYHPLAVTTLRHEIIMLFSHCWVLVYNRDGGHSVARLD